MRHFLIFLILLIPYPALSQTTKDIQQSLINQDFEKAISKGNKLIKKDTLNANAYYLVGYALDKSEQDSKSLSYLAQAYSLDSTNRKYALAYAEIATNLGRYKLSLNIYKKLLERDSTDKLVLSRIASISLKKEEFRQAIYYYQQLTNIDSLNDSYFQKLGFAFTKQKMFKEAIGAFKKSFELDSFNLLNVRQLSLIYLKTQKNDLAIKIAERGIRLDSTEAVFYKYKAIGLFNKNYNFRAIPIFEKAMQFGDSTYEIRKYYAVAHLEAFKFKKAKPMFVELFQEDSTDYLNSIYLGRCYINLNMPDSAIHYSLKAVELLQPNKNIMINLYTDLAIAYHADKQYWKALKTYDLKRNLNSTRTYRDNYDIARIYEALDKKEEALSFYKKVMIALEDRVLEKETNKDYIFVSAKIRYLKEQLHFERK